MNPGYLQRLGRYAGTLGRNMAMQTPAGQIYGAYNRYRQHQQQQQPRGADLDRTPAQQSQYGSPGSGTASPGAGSYAPTGAAPQQINPNYTGGSPAPNSQQGMYGSPGSGTGSSSGSYVSLGAADRQALQAAQAGASAPNAQVMYGSGGYRPPGAQQNPGPGGGTQMGASLGGATPASGIGASLDSISRPQEERPAASQAFNSAPDDQQQPQLQGLGMNDESGADDMLAQGAIVTQPKRVILGDQGPEAVIPLTPTSNAKTGPLGGQLAIKSRYARPSGPARAIGPLKQDTPMIPNRVYR